MAITKCEAGEKQQDQAEYDTVTKLPSPAKEININTFPVLMKNDGWNFQFICAQPLLWNRVRWLLLSFFFFEE